MNNIFINEMVLEEKYSCYGHFYSILCSPNKIKCRSVLEIIVHEKKPNVLNDLLDRIPDAIFIMMNPGASKPSEPSDNQVDSNLISEMKIDLVLACPDKTQYQLMRIMEFKKWNHVRVLNLSDIRERESGNFYLTLKNLNANNNFTVHSCFDSNRKVELKKKISINNPIYAAWGIGDDLDSLIKLCVDSFDGQTQFLGLEKEDGSNKFYHPLLKGKPFNQREWLKRILLL